VRCSNCDLSISRDAAPWRFMPEFGPAKRAVLAGQL
jgi:hypothetical protein